MTKPLIAQRLTDGTTPAGGRLWPLVIVACASGIAALLPAGRHRASDPERRARPHPGRGHRRPRPGNEAILETAITTLAASKSLLVIAHRLRTVLAADQILVLDDGRITERGTHGELLDADGTYASFWRERRRADGWRLAATR